MFFCFCFVLDFPTTSNYKSGYPSPRLQLLAVNTRGKKKTLEYEEVVFSNFVLGGIQREQNLAVECLELKLLPNNNNNNKKALFDHHGTKLFSFFVSNCQKENNNNDNKRALHIIRF
eukprot:GEMP01075125.1.p1 GENE.GEMP01075125.1~~GEMP01075125.1.p1  ORF type:complete len:117 (+),score=11.63 GEMP01075125.1:798-1148(+)